MKTCTSLVLRAKSSFVLLALGCALPLGCSAGGAGGDNAQVSPTTTTPGSLRPGDSSPSVTTPSNPGTGTGGELFDPNDVEPTDECDGVIPVVFRDFNDTHPDFEMDFSGDVVRRQLLSAQLGAGDKPVFASSVGCPAQQGTPMACANWMVDKPVITSAATFDQWYRDVPNVNMTFPRELELTESQPGSGLYVFSSNDFFPLGPNEGFGVSPPNQGKNFLFTTEIHLNFEYIAQQRFTFRGDDDLWIFINKRLALDLGSMHGQEQGTIDFDAQAADLGIRPGGVYQMDIFHAERHTNASNFSIETNIACFTPVVVY
ncbi:MAG TPA: fibro-slime domain-containing protein [Polyangiaceae bacterium]|nr:fibro-slime domain-containing protein [Polyangiaceae bacterium]